MFKLMDKYRPESKQAKKMRLRARAQLRASGKPDTPTKRPHVVRQGVNTVTSLVEQKKAQLVVIAHDVDPIEVTCWIWYNWQSCGIVWKDFDTRIVDNRSFQTTLLYLQKIKLCTARKLS